MLTSPRLWMELRGGSGSHDAPRHDGDAACRLRSSGGYVARSARTSQARELTPSDARGGALPPQEIHRHSARYDQQTRPGEERLLEE